MSSLLPPVPETDDDPETMEADPVAIARRVLMMRRLVASAVQHYRQTLAFVEELDVAMPVPFRPPFDDDAEPEDERGAWWRLLKDAEGDFYSAEASLAVLICNLYDDLAPEHKRVGPKVGSYFQERGIEIDDVVYLLVDDPAALDSGKNIIALCRRDRVIDLND
jgi:hypothetical protein